MDQDQASFELPSRPSPKKDTLITDAPSAVHDDNNFEDSGIDVHTIILDERSHIRLLISYNKPNPCRIIRLGSINSLNSLANACMGKWNIKSLFKLFYYSKGVDRGERTWATLADNEDFEAFMEFVKREWEMNVEADLGSGEEFVYVAIHARSEVADRDEGFVGFEEERAGAGDGEAR